MDGWLKGLIAVTCAVLIACGGYYLISEYARGAARQKIIEADTARQAVVNSPEYRACRESLNSSALGDAKRLRDLCRQNGYITYDEQLKAESGN